MARTLDMTRSSKDASSDTGAFSSRAISLIRTSASSRTVHLAQQLTEPVAGAHHAHLQRRYADPRQLRHLIVTQFVHILQKERFPLLRTQLLQRPIDLLPPRRLLGGMLV